MGNYMSTYMSTLSITWTTPLPATRLLCTISAPLTLSRALGALSSSDLPDKVLA